MLNKKQFYINGDWVDPVNPNDLENYENSKIYLPIYAFYE